VTANTPLTAALADRYRIERELGQGGMAIVYLAEDVRHHRRVAIKVLHPQLSAVIGSDRFLKEIELTANLQHPHILPLFDSGEAGGLLYYVMPFIEGETLRTRLQRERQLAIPDALRIAREVADALAYAHGHGVVHRDIKPENVLVHGNHALVADFGIALAVEEAGGTRLTQTGVSIGTPQYMAPEQAMGDRAADHRVDIYALGAITYEMLVGEPPFTGLTSQAIVAKVMTEDPKGLVLQRRNIPEGVEAAVLTALEKLPADRFATAAEFSQALAAAPAVSPRTAAARRHARSRGWILPAAGAVALAAAAFWLGTRVSRPAGSAWTFGRAIPVTWDYGLEVHPAISPDGRLVAYAAGNSATNLRVFVRPVSGGRSVPLVEDSMQTQSSPRWSPDGSRVLFLSRDGVFSVPSFGGPPRQELAGRRSGAITSAAWAPDGQRIAYTAGDSIFVREGDGTSRFVARAHDVALCNWSPDGRALACSAGNLQYALANQQFGNLSPSQLVVVNVEDGAVDSLTDRAASNQSPVWAGPRRILFISNRHGPRDIYSIDLDAGGGARGEPVRLTTGLGAHTLSLSSDGSHIAYAVFTATANTWALPIPRAGAVSPYGATQVTHGNQLVESFSVSRDGEWLFYDSNLAGNADLYRIPARGGEPERLTTDPSDDFFPAPSPDGREVAFHSWRTGNRDAFVIPLDGGPVQQVTATPNVQEVGPKWSPDGRTLIYFEFEGPNDTLARGAIWTSTRDEQGRWGAPVRRVPRGNWPAWSPDGARLAYAIGSVANRVFVEPATGGEPRLVYDAGADGPRVEQVVWSVDSRTLYFKSHDASGIGEIWALAASGGAPRLVTRFDDPSRPSNRYNMGVTGSHIYFAIDERQSDVWVMELTKGEAP
jgi:Tol biopolymer transport system component/tRNA A-37 threonylcarbamoyl transferase component Bud32